MRILLRAGWMLASSPKYDAFVHNLGAKVSLHFATEIRGGDSIYLVFFQAMSAIGATQDARHEQVTLNKFAL
jgi:hypothetical protein